CGRSTGQWRHRRTGPRRSEQQTRTHPIDQPAITSLRLSVADPVVRRVRTAIWGYHGIDEARQKPGHRTTSVWIFTERAADSPPASSPTDVLPALHRHQLSGRAGRRVHSNLAAVGLTATVSTRLAAAGISCNVIAGNLHDHLFVPHDRGLEALQILNQLAS